MKYNSTILENLKIIKVVKIWYKNGFVIAIKKDGVITYWINPENYSTSYKFLEEKDDFDNLEEFATHILELIEDGKFATAIDDVLENAQNEEEEVFNKIHIVVPMTESDDDIADIIDNLEFQELDAFTFDFMGGLMVVILDDLEVFESWIYKNSDKMRYIGGELRKPLDIESEIKLSESAVESGYYREDIELELKDILG